MVFSRSLKTDIKRLLTNLFSITAIIMAGAFLAFNVAFSASSTSIPVEILWENDDATMRPAQVFLELRKSGDNTVLQTATLTDANVDPNNQNRWTYHFDNVNADAGDVYVISQQSFDGYQTTASAQSTITGTPGTTSIDVVNDDLQNNRYKTLSQPYDALLFFTKGNYYLWTFDDYSSNYTSIADAFIEEMGLNISSSSVGYFHGHNVQNPGNPKRILVGHYEDDRTFGTITQVRISGNANNVTIYGSYSTQIHGSTASFTNTASSEHTLTIHHINEDGTEFAPDVVTQYEDGDTYTATPIDNDHYSPELQGGQATGIITEDMELTYVYHPLYHNVIYQFTGDVVPSGADALLPATEEHLHGSTIAVAQDPAATGYRFLGWKINGADAGASFTMPTEDVIITGTWEHFNGYFTPEISKQVINAPEYYRALDTVPFEITVTNTADFDISNVVVNELLDGAVFSNGDGYQVDSDDQATIPTLAAGESITLYASYVIPKDLTQTIINTAQITSATADNYYYLDNSQEYTATASFDV